MTAFGYQNGLPGNSALYETVERNILWLPMPGTDVRTGSVVVSSAAVDSGSTPTTYLRPGLIVGKLDSGGEYMPYDADATDGTQEAVGVCIEEVFMLDPATGAGADRHVRIVVGGGLIVGELINLDAQARAQLVAKGFLFDDLNNPRLPFSRVSVVAASATLTAAQSGRLIMNTGAVGAVTYTLPAIAVGLQYEFLSTENQNMVIASGEGDNMIIANDLSADSITFSTASQMIGARARVVAIYVGGVLKWLPEIISTGTAGTTAT